MYKYTKNSLLINPIKYSYSPYEGDEFIQKWIIHRSSYSKEISKYNQLNNKTLTYPKLPKILPPDGSEYDSFELGYLCDFLLHKYEATKKIYSKYINSKPIKSSGFKNIENYISTALLIEEFYSKTKDIKYLNCLIKLCDLFQSDKEFLLHSDIIEELITKEINHISNLISHISNIKTKEYKNFNNKSKIFNNPKKIKRLTLICCDSSRSSIYLQSLINANIYPENIIYMDNKKSKDKISRYPFKSLTFSPDWLFVPKYYIHPLELAKQNKINIIHAITKSINSDFIYECLKKINSKLIIYCGFGGEIVNTKLLKYFNFIHCHAGTLPKYRGSTTFYYEILDNEFPSVSCILLDKTIDTGPILSMKSFPLPFKTDNIDTLYEPSIRANLLCDVIFDSGLTLKLQSRKEQPKDKHKLNYFIIHPVLKHLSYSFLGNPE